MTGEEKGLKPVSAEVRLEDPYWTLNNTLLIDGVFLQLGIGLNRIAFLFLVDKRLPLREVGVEMKAIVAADMVSTYD